MKTFRITFDATTITLTAEDANDAIKLLQEYDKKFKIEKDVFVYRWDRNNFDKVQIFEVKPERGIIQWESH